MGIPSLHVHASSRTPEPLDDPASKKLIASCILPGSLQFSTISNYCHNSRVKAASQSSGLQVDVMMHVSALESPAAAPSNPIHFI